MSRTSQTHGERPAFVLDEETAARDVESGLGAKSDAMANSSASLAPDGTSLRLSLSIRPLLGSRQAPELSAIGLRATSFGAGCEGFTPWPAHAGVLPSVASRACAEVPTRDAFLLRRRSAHQADARLRQATQLVCVDVGRQGGSGTQFAAGITRGDRRIGRSVADSERQVERTERHCVHGLARVGLASVGDGDGPVRSRASAPSAGRC